VGSIPIGSASLDGPKGLLLHQQDGHWQSKQIDLVRSLRLFFRSSPPPDGAKMEGSSLPDASVDLLSKTFKLLKLSSTLPGAVLHSSN